MFHQLVNEFYSRFLFKLNKIPQDIHSITFGHRRTFFNEFSTKVRKLLISEGVQVPPRIPTETNHQVNQTIILVINTSAEDEHNIGTIKASVQQSGGSRHNGGESCTLRSEERV